MNPIFSSKKLKSLLPYFLLAVAVIAVYKIVIELHVVVGVIQAAWRIITPFFYGFLLAYVVNVPCGGIQKLLGKVKIKFIRKRKKPLSIILVFILIALVLYSVLNLVIPTVYSSVSYFVSQLSTYYANVLQFVEGLNEMEFLGIDLSAERIVSMLQNMFQDISFESLASPINALFGVSSAIFTFFLAFISSIYILLEKDKFKEFLSKMLKAFLSAPAYNAVLKYADRLNLNFKRYIFVQTIDGCILGTIVTIELTILRSPYALVLGIMLGIVNYIPYFGSIIGSITTVLIVFFTQGFTTALIAAIMLLVTQQIDGNVIQPRLMGGSFSLSPLLVIICITIGGALSGPLGMIVAIPIIAVLKDILDNIIEYYEHKKAGKLEEPEEL